MKKVLKITFVALLFLSVSSTFAQIRFQVGDNKKEIEENGKKEWQKFEQKVGDELIRKHKKENVFYHPYLIVAGKTIIPDYLVEVSTNTYMIVEVKASKYSDLATKEDLTNNCTSNQKVAYPKINNGDVTAKVKSNRFNVNASKELEANDRIVIQEGVLFYVNSEKNKYHSYVTREMKK